MTHTLPPLDFAPDALQPFLSPETFEYHHGKHHRAYVEKLNGLLEGSDLAGLGLTELVQRAEGGMFNNAAQHYNHSVYWRSIAPRSGEGGGNGPGADLLARIESDFGSVDELAAAFKQAAKTHFGSGWCWLSRDEGGKLTVETTSDAGCPLTAGRTPVLTCDVWEHAYYIDYRNARPDYVDAFWKGVNWDFATRAYTQPGELEDDLLGRAASGS